MQCPNINKWGHSRSLFKGVWRRGRRHDSQIKLWNGTQWLFFLTMCLNKGEFQAIPHTVVYEDQVMMVVVEGRRTQCWNCKPLDHFSKSCPQKTTKNTASPSSTAATTTTATIATTSTATLTNPQNTETGDHTNKEEGWTQVSTKGGNIPPNKTATTTQNLTTKLKNTTITVITTVKVTVLTPEKIKSPTPSNKKEKKKKKKHIPEEQPEEMDITTNIKRRRGSDDIAGDGGGKSKVISHSPNQKSNLKQNPNAQHKSFHFNSHHTLNIPNIQKPPIPNTAYLWLPRLFSWSHSETREQTPSSSSSSSRKRTKSASNEDRQALNGIYFCSDRLESLTIDHHLKKTFNLLIALKTIDNHKIVSNPYLLRGAPMVTTFVLSAGNRTKELWRFIEEASRVDVRLAEMEHPPLKKMLSFCSVRVPIYVHPCFHRALNLKYPLDVGWISRDGRVTTELGTGSLRQAVGILAPEDFQPVVDSE